MNSLLLLFSLLFQVINSNDGEICSLTGERSSNPYPSLAKCYKYNNDACCTSVHDDYISSYISEFLTPSCMRKYTELEDLMCLGCHPYQSLFVDSNNKIINICYSFAFRFWNTTEKEKLNEKTTIFDNCGFKASEALKKQFGETLTYIIPSQKIKSFPHFIQSIHIPFFENYTIHLMDEENTKTQKLCFGSASFNHITYSNIIILIFSVFSFGFLC